jgi:hypothetical protein
MYAAEYWLVGNNLGREEVDVIVATGGSCQEPEAGQVLLVVE